MDIRLESFLALCEEMNYRLAAESLHLSQPAVTKHIQSLESEYGVELFSFDGRKLHRTEASFILETYALAQKSNYDRVLQDLKTGEKPHIYLGVTKTFANYGLSFHVKRFLDARDMQLTLVVESSENLFSLLKKNQVDFLLLEGKFDKSFYDYSLLSEMTFRGLCSIRHPFANKEVSLTRALQETLFIREVGSSSYEFLIDYLGHQGYKTKDFSRLVSVNSLPLLVDLLDLNLGISFGYDIIPRTKATIAPFDIKGFSSKHELNIVALKDGPGLEKAKMFFLEHINKP